MPMFGVDELTGPLVGGFTLGEQIYYTGPSETFESGDRIEHGQRGKVVGPGSLAHKGKGVKVLFPGNKGRVDCYLTQVRRLRAASAATPRLRPTRNAAHAPCISSPASAVQ